MKTILNNLLDGAAAKKILAAAVLAGSFSALPTAPAFADRGKWDREDEQRDHDGDHDRDRDRDRDDRRDDVNFEFGFFSRPRYREHEEVRVQRVYVEPVYRTVCDKVWVEPVYRTVCEKVWAPPVTKTVTDRVLVPDRFEERDVVGVDFRGRRCTIKQRFLVERAHYERVQREIEIAPGHFDSIERRVLVSEGHFDKVDRQELVTPGHWEVQRERVIVEEHRHRHDDGDFKLKVDLGN